MKLALNLLVKDETDVLDKCLNSAKDLVDEIVVGYTSSGNPKTERILKKHNCTVVQIPWKNDFSYARNELLKATNAELVFWVDSDDLIELAENVKRGEFKSKVKQLFRDMPILGEIWAVYLYDFDSAGNCISQVERERIVRKEHYEWIGKLHEVCMPKQAMQWAAPNMFVIRHNTTHERMTASMNRNIKMSLDIYAEEKEGGRLTHRTTMNLARSLVVLKAVTLAGKTMRGMDAALPFYKEALMLAENDTQRCEIYLKLADIYRRSRMVDEAMATDAEVVKLKPQWPDGYIGLGDSYKQIDRYEEAITSYLTSLIKEPSRDLLCQDPSKYKLKVYKSLANCLFYSEKPELAMEYIDAALKLCKNDEDMNALKVIIEDVLKKNRLTTNIIEFKELLEKEGEGAKVKYLAKMLPSWMEQEAFAVRLKAIYDPKFEKNKMIIYCGEAHRPWSPLSVREGIGGSEEMVIYLTKELAALGWNITVYCECDAPGNYGGVNYQNYWSYVPELACDVFIAWRNEQFGLIAPKAGKRYLWLHDVKEDKNWLLGAENNFDKVFFLSKFHRSLLTKVPEEKVYYTRNAILPLQFKQFDDVPRAKNRCVFASSPIRGLAILLDCWPEIRKAIPDATLQIYYGFGVWDAAHRNDSAMLKKKQDMLAKIEALKPYGVQYIGNVGHLELAQALASADYWTNPNFVFDEISCITAMKAMAAGCWPITSDRGALGETTINGTLSLYRPGESMGSIKERFTNEVTSLMREGVPEEKRKECKFAARERYSMAVLAKEWDEFFRGGKNEGTGSIPGAA